ncbi:hypothetical protein BH11BAC4_BH11BAC4_15560 [soil metagenome]
MKPLLIAFFIMISLNLDAQRTNKHTPVLQKGVYISFNPHSLLEAEQGAVGVGVGYRVTRRIEVWTELNYLFRGFFHPDDEFRNLHGFRSITSFKYFYNNKHGFFAGAELRVKKYSFDDKSSFENLQAGDSLFNFKYKPAHTLIGGGIFWGKRFKLGASGKFELEGNIGIGVKYRMIDRKNVPVGYTQIKYRAPDTRPNTDEEAAYPYFPATVRFIYHL